MHGHGHWCAVLLARFEEPGPYALYGFFIQAHTQAAYHVDVARPAVRSDDCRQYHRSLIFGFAGFFREVRLRRELCHRRSHTDIAQLVNTAAKSSALSRSVPRPRPGANTVAGA